MCIRDRVICIFQLYIHGKLLTIKVRVKRCASMCGCKLAVCELHVARLQPCDGARCARVVCALLLAKYLGAMPQKVARLAMFLVGEALCFFITFTPYRKSDME